MGKTSKARRSYSPPGKRNSNPAEPHIYDVGVDRCRSCGGGISRVVGRQKPSADGRYRGRSVFFGFDHRAHHRNRQIPRRLLQWAAITATRRSIAASMTSRCRTKRGPFAGTWRRLGDLSTRPAPGRSRQTPAARPRTQPLAVVPLPRSPAAGGCFGVGRATPVARSERSPPGPLPQAI